MPTPIESTEHVKELLGISTNDDDELLEQLQTMADEFINSHCGRDFRGGTFTELHPAGVRMIFLTNYPVTAVTSVKVDPDGNFGSESLRDPQSYVLYPDRGVIAARRGSFGMPAMNGVQVVYSTAENAVPPPVARAYAELIGFWYRQTKTAVQLGQINLLSRNDGGVESRYAVPNGKVPAGILQSLALYRMPSV